MNEWVSEICKDAKLVKCGFKTEKNVGCVLINCSVVAS